MKDHYQTLGVARTATADEIKRAYRRLASQHHPDKGGDKARFQEIQEAYDVLSDAARRQAYDNPQQQFQFGPGVNFGFNFDDVFQMFNGGRAGAQGRAIRMSLWITLHDLASGGKRLVSLASQTGTHNIEIDVPLGINDGDSVRYLQTGPNGQDLIIQFRIQPHPIWQRNNLDLTVDHSVSVWDLVLGGSTKIKDILGHELEVTVPANCQPGALLRLRKKGLPANNGDRGDLFVRLLANIPYPVPEPLRDAIQKHR